MIVMQYPKIFAGIFLLVTFMNKANSEVPAGCKSGSANVLKDMMTKIGECTAKLGFTGRTKAEKMNCIMKCVLQSIQVIDEEGYLDLENAIKFILRECTVPVISQVLAVYQKTFELTDCVIGAGARVEPSDPNCKSYEPFVKCLTNFFMNLCKEGPPKYPVINYKDSEDIWHCSDC